MSASSRETLETGECWPPPLRLPGPPPTSTRAQDAASTRPYRDSHTRARHPRLTRSRLAPRDVSRLNPLPLYRQPPLGRTAQCTQSYSPVTAARLAANVQVARLRLALRLLRAPTTAGSLPQRSHQHSLRSTIPPTQSCARARTWLPSTGLVNVAQSLRTSSRALDAPSSAPVLRPRRTGDLALQRLSLPALVSLGPRCQARAATT